MLVNTQYFREPAIYYQKNGKYPCGVKGSHDYNQWWMEEAKRCLGGYTVGGVWIPGYYYFYLNYCPIQIVEKVGNRKAGIRKLDFPKFWDVDYMYFMSLHIAKYGTTPEELRSLPVSIPLQEDEKNLRGGHHLLFLKPRGIGASFKNGSCAERNFSLIPRSKTYMFADQKEFLNKDGIFNKFVDYHNWINKYTEFRADSEVKADMTNMHYKASYYNDDGLEVGNMSEVMGVTIANDKNKARGKRGMLYLFEEAGMFGSLQDSWNIVRNSVEEGEIVYGTMVGFGTGGTEGADFESMEEMFSNPRSYNILAFNNIWDEGLEGTDCGMFSPANRIVQYTDEMGNSDLKKGNEVIQTKYEEAEESSDPTYANKVRAELPMTPQQAMLNTSGNKFATGELISWRNRVIGDPYFRKVGTGKRLFINSRGEVEAKLESQCTVDRDGSAAHPPITTYPHSQKQDLHGCVVEYDTPYTLVGEGEKKYIPDNLYIICHDPYADNDAEDTTSLGAAYVIMNYNNFGVPGNRIVASWIGRPRTTDEYNKILFMLARRWNAKIGYERDRGDVLGYAKRFKMIEWLAPDFELAWDQRIVNRRISTMKFGMSINAGKNNPKVLVGNNYIADWLTEPVADEVSEDGKNVDTFLNLHYIYDLGLLSELKAYNGKGNYDRISALRIGMFYMRELAYKDVKPDRDGRKHKSFSKFAKARRQSA